MNDASPAASGPAKQSFAALRHAGFRAALITGMLAMMADNIEHVISYWVVFQKFQSPALAGFAVVSHWVPFLMFSVASGALADRFDPRRLIQCGSEQRFGPVDNSSRTLRATRSPIGCSVGFGSLLLGGPVPFLLGDLDQFLRGCLVELFALGEFAYLPHSQRAVFNDG